MIEGRRGAEREKGQNYEQKPNKRPYCLLGRNSWFNVKKKFKGILF